MSNSTPEEKIAVLNVQKQQNTEQINNLNASIADKQTLISNYTMAIEEFENQIIAYQAEIDTLESNNSVIDEIIVDETPPQSEV
jgi:chromosome segregation ATPase